MIGLQLHAPILSGYTLQWIKEKGFDGLLTNKYGTNKSRLQQHGESILYSFSQKPPMNASEATQRISEMTSIIRSEQQVRAFMKRHGLKFIKCGHIPSKADNETQHQWVETELKWLLYQTLPISPQLHLFNS